MELDYSVFPHQSPLPSFGWLTHMLYLGYLGQTFGAATAKRHLCHNILRYVEDEDNIVISQGLLRPEYSYLGLPGTFSVSHDLYPYLRCNSIAADNSRRIIIDCEVPEGTKTVVPQNLFSPYAGIARSQAELRRASLLPPIFFFRPDHSIGLPLKTAQSAESHSRLLLYDNWCPLEGRTSIKMRIAWYGYSPWQTQIQLQNRRKEPITLPRLVQLVANGVDRFLRQDHGPITDPAFPEWMIGDRPYISPDRIVLVGVVGASLGSIMPIMQLRN